MDKNKRLEKCIVDRDKKIFSINDPGTNNRVMVNVEPRICHLIQIDGKLNEIQPVRCDWSIKDTTANEYLFIELKGNDFRHASEQLGNTISWFKKNITPFHVHKTCYSFMKGTAPKNNTAMQQLRLRFLKKHGCNIEFPHSHRMIIF